MMVAPIKETYFTPEEHLRFFGEFVTGVMQTGGTTPHMLLAVEAARGHDLRERLWRGGCYAFVYNIPYAELLWQSWGPGEWKYDELVGWLTTEWKGIRLRKERKAVRSPEKLARCMTSYAEYIDMIPKREWYLSEDMDPKTRYITAFDDMCNSVYGMGRYIVIRWLEFAKRSLEKDLSMYDLHPKDGEHPRKALALMYPEYHDELMGGNDAETLEIVNDVVEYARQDLKEFHNVDVDHYTMQSLLCEYKQSVLAMKQYPGKSIDTEVNYWDKLVDYWGDNWAADSKFWEYRKNIFPSFALGEEQGWRGVRDELGKVLREHHYTWSDYLYDYAATTDFSNPVRRQHA